MKPDLYTKIVLTVIAVCLVYFALNRLQIVPSVNAHENNVQNKNYVSVPVKPNGSIDVNLVSSSEPVVVDLVKVGGSFVYTTEKNDPLGKPFNVIRTTDYY